MMTLARWLPLVLVGALAATAAGALLFSTFKVYDDEGYVLFSLMTFAEGGGLYERTYSQYGPFFFLFHQVLHFAGLQFTNTHARLLTMAYWLGAAGLCASLVWRLTRSRAATAFTLGGVFLHLLPTAWEPSHPGGFIVLVTAATAWFGTCWTAHPNRLAIATGIAGAALLLTKTNVGLFLFLGTGAWWILHLDTPRWSKSARAGLAAGALALLPFLLVRGQLGSSRIAIFAVVSAFAGVATVLAVARGAQPITRRRNLAALSIAGGGLVVCTTLGVAAQGTSLRGLLEGVLLGPIRHPLVYTAFLPLNEASLALAIGSLTLAAFVVIGRPVTAPLIVAGGRWIGGAFVLVSLMAALPFPSDILTLSYGLSLAWLFTHPLDSHPATQPERAWLGLLLVTQALHAYPIPGSQISWGTFLVVPLVALGIHDAVRVRPATAGRRPKRIVAFGAAMLTLAMVLRCGHSAWSGAGRIRNGDPLRLPGAALYLPENLTTSFRILSRNAVAHADVLFSLPGMLSFHLWTGVPPPTPINATHWFTLLSPAQQDAIRAKLDASPRSCVIVQRYLYEFLVRNGIPTETPLTSWLWANYEPAFALGTYEFLVRKGRSIAAIGTATVHQANAGATARHKVTLTLGEATPANVHSIELGWLGEGGRTTAATWTNASAELFMMQLDSAGAIVAPPHQVTFPFDVHGLMRLDLFTEHFPAEFPIGDGVVYLRNSAGQRIAEARFVR